MTVPTQPSAADLPQKPQRAHIRDTRTPHPLIGTPASIKATLHALSDENRRLRTMLNEAVCMVGDANDDLIRREWRLIEGERDIQKCRWWEEGRRMSV